MPNPAKRSVLLSVSLLIGLVFVGMYFPTAQRLYVIWSDNGNSHGFLLAAIFIYAFGRLLLERASARPRIYLLGLLGLIGFSVVWFLTKVALIEKLEFVAFVFIPLMLVWTIYGFRVAKWFVLPTLILVFSTPIFQLFHNQMQLATALGSDILLQVLGLTFYRDGLVVYIPNGGFVIEKGCSGLSALTMGVAIALIYAWINKLKWKGALISVLVVSFLAYLSNVARVGIIIMIGNHYSMEHPLVTDHAWVGWITFAVVIILFLLVAQRFVKRSALSDSQEGMNREETGAGRFPAIISVSIAIAAMAVGPVLFLVQAKANEVPVNQQYHLPNTLKGWEKVEVGPAVIKRWKPNYEVAGNRAFQHAFYQKGDKFASLFVMQFDRQKAGDEAINISNRSYDNANAARLSVTKVSAPEAQIIGRISEEHLRLMGAKDMLVWAVYRLENRWIGSPSLTKLFNLYEILLGRPSVTVYIIGVELHGDELTSARRALDEFVQSLQASEGLNR